MYPFFYLAFTPHIPNPMRSAFLIRLCSLSVVLLVWTASAAFAQEKPATVDSLVQVKLTESAKTQFVGADGALPKVVSQARTGVQTLDQLARQYDVNRMERVFRPAGKHEPRHVRAGLDRWYTIHYQSDVTSETVAKSYLNSSSVEASSPVYKIDLQTNRPSSTPVGEENATQNSIPNDPRYEDQWHYNNTSSNVGTPDADIDLREAHSLETGNPEVIISISDNGTDLDHPDIQSRLWVNEEEDINGNGVFDPYPADEGGDLNGEDDDDNGFVDDVVGYDHEDSDPNPSPNSGESHGTHVAGTVAAQNGNEQYGSGVAGGDGTSDSGVRLMINRAHENQNVAQAAESITYAADNGALVSNASWGEGWILDPIFRPPIRDAIDYFRETAGGEGTPMNGGIFVSAAGNAGEPVGDYFPARYGPAFTVGATDANDDRASYSNYGDEVDISAPGGGDGNIPDSWVQSTMVDDGFGGMPGTSMAAPHVSGVIALVASALAEEGLTISNEAMENGLVNTADDVGNPDIGPRVNAFNALNALEFINPTLSLGDGTNTPSSGTTDDTFTFEVTYTSRINFEPDNVSLHLDGETYTMQSTGSDYSNGVVFETSVSNLSAGTYEYHFEATVNNEHVDEQLRDPAEGPYEFTVTQSAEGYDLAVDPNNTSISPTNPSPGSTIDVEAWASNEGSETYTNETIQARLVNPDGTELDSDQATISSIGPGENQQYDLAVNLPSDAGDGTYQVFVEVTPELDSNPDNNQVVRSFFLGDPPNTDQYEVREEVLSSQPGDWEDTFPEVTSSFEINGSTFNVQGLSTDCEAGIIDPSGDLETIPLNVLETWSDYQAVVAFESYFGSDPCEANEVMFTWVGSETTNGPSYESRQVSGEPGQTVTFDIDAPSSGDFANVDEDYIFDSSPHSYDEWYDPDGSDDEGSEASLEFDIPSDASTGENRFYIMSEHEGSVEGYISRVQINVVGTPSISVSPDSVLATVTEGETSEQTLTISNGGSSDLVLSSITGSDEWIQPGDFDSSVSPGGSIEVPITLDADSLSAGTYEGSVTVVSNDEDNSSVTVPVSFTVESLPLPEPEILSIDYPGSISIGDTISITVEGGNEASVAEDAAIAVSFPSLSAEGDTAYVANAGTDGANSLNSSRPSRNGIETGADDTPGFQLFAPGELIENKDGTEMEAEYLLTKYGDDTWDGGEQNQLSLNVQPQSAGTFDIYVRVTMGSGGTFFNAPETGDTNDQQGWSVMSRSVEVEPAEETVSIAEARSQGPGSTVTVEGTVTRAFGAYARIQDESGSTGASALVIRQTDGPQSGDFQGDIESGDIQPGTTLRVSGRLSVFNGLFQINNDDLTSYTVQGQGTPPSPQEVSLSDVQGPGGEDYESELLRISGLSFPSASGTFESGTTYTVEGESSTSFDVRVQNSNETNIIGEPIPEGSFTYRGVLGQFNGSSGNDEGYQLLPVQPSDVETQSAITLDGQLGESAYIPLGGNSGDDETGFGSANDIDALMYYPDETDEMLHVAVAGTLETDNTNGYALFLNVEGSGAPTGAAPGDPLGFSGETTNFHFLSGDESGNNTDFTADFEVDYVLAVSPTGVVNTTKAVASSYTSSSRVVEALGTTDESGSVGTGTGPNGETVSFAHLNSETSMTGAEFQIPFSEIGATADNNLQVFAVIVSDTGYFSNEAIPGDGTMISGSETDGAGNPGNNAQWHDYAGGPYHTSGSGLPVEIVTFTAQRSDQDAVLNWKTASETNNTGFAVQHAVGSRPFEQVGWVEGAGTTTEAQTYRFVIEDLSAGTHRFRLKQEDVDGSTSLSKAVTLNVQPEGPIAVRNVAPNPVTGTSTLRFIARESGPVTVVLYDVLGREVKTLHQGRVSGGQTQRVSLDASGLSSGTYFLRLKGEGFTRSHRVTVAQ